MEASSGGHNMPKIMTFRPTWEEFKDFNKYIGYIESQGAHKAGVCKIIPPKEWVPRKKGYRNIDVTIPAPIQQIVHGKQGLYTQFNVQKKALSSKEFEELAKSDKFKPPRHTDYEDLERKYWKNVTFVNPIYGADVSGSLTDPEQKSWNICKLGSILDCLGDDYGISIEGVNTAYLYFGMWKTTFAWHTEDMDLYSINYIHFGAPKQWYAIPPEHGRRLERLAAGFFPDMAEQCQAFLRHKMTLISPMILKRYSIPYDTIVQEAGEIMITFPYGYHAGFNHGFNCAESTNFASLRWIEYGKRCVQCHCRKDSVKIDMGAFVKRFQPKLYDLWLNGKDIAPHPEDDQSKLYNHHHNEIITSTSPTKRMSRKKTVDPTIPVIERVARCSLKRYATTDSLPKDALGKPRNAKKAKSSKKPKEKKKKSRSISGAMNELTDSETTDASTDLSEVNTDVETDDTTVTCLNDHEDSSPTQSTSTHTGPCTLKGTSSKGLGEKLLEVDGDWALSLTKLWQFNRADFDAEKEYNILASTVAPYCAVCTVLSRKTTEEKIDKKGQRPRSTIPEMPQSCFQGYSDLDINGKSSKNSSKPRALLTCSCCQVTVHDTCYGVKFLPNGPGNWQCSRCTQNSHEARCILCSLRGGALKPTADNRWAHITCAIANPEVTFKNINQREPIDVSKISSVRGTLKCKYCGVFSFKKDRDRFGKCVQCCVGKCNKSFHLTCAQAAGLTIDIGSGPCPLQIFCYKHMKTDKEKSEKSDNRPMMKVKDEVYAKHKNGRYYLGEVTNIMEQMYYCVLFDDNSISNDLYPTDVINFRVQDGVPPLGSFVQVEWPDGVTYNGLFQGTRSVKLYTVEFEDGSEVHLEANQVYSIHESLPQHVQKKLSYASEMKNDVFYRRDVDLLLDKRTRGVQVNYNYRWNW